MTSSNNTHPPPNPILSSALAQIDADLALVPPHVQTVVVAAADDQGLSAGVATRFGHGWKLSATVEQRWRRQRPNAKVTLVRQW